MRKNIIKTIFFKEMKDIFRDKKTVFMMIILPILLYPVLMIGFSQIMVMAQTNMSEKQLAVAFDFKADDALLTIIEKNNEQEDGKLNLLQSKNIEGDFDKGTIAAYVKQNKTENGFEYEIYMNGSNDDSSSASKRLKTVFTEYKEKLVEVSLEKAGLDKKTILEPITYKTVNQAKDEEMAGYILGQILPMILIIGILLGAIYPAIDVMAGEKERGTLETLLTLPVSNLELVIGKYLAVATVAMLSAVLNIISIVISLIFMFLTMTTQMDKQIQFAVAPSQMVIPVLITLICILLFTMVITAVVMCVCSLAKSFKEAQNYSTPVMLICMLPAYASMIPTIEFNTKTAAIPVVNISLLIKSVLMFKYDVKAMAIVLISSIAFAILSIMLLTKMFQSEAILFGEGKGFSFLEKRSDILKNTLPGVSDSIILYAIVMLLFVYVGSLVQMKYGLMGIAMTQFLIIGVPILFALYIKTDLRKLFSLKLPKISGVIGGFVLWLGAFIGIHIISQFLLYIFPQNMAVLEALSEQMFSETSFFVNLLVIAVLPALCEEMLFRGFIFNGLRFNGNDRKNTYKSAIILSGIMFGMMHLYFIKIIPTAILGIIFAYTVYKTGSIFVAMLLHFINNGIAVVATYYPQGVIYKIYNRLEIDFNHIDLKVLSVLILSSIILIMIGISLLKKQEKQIS